jgi:carboxypeptidase family protein
VKVRGLLLAAAVLTLAACGRPSDEAAERPAAEPKETCVAPDGEQEGIDGTEPAHPIAIGPDGPVMGLRRELAGSALYISDSGVCSVVETAQGTWALTGIVVAEENDAPVPGATVSLEALEPPELNVVLVARSDDDGAFAFVNVPVKGGRTCYRTRVTASGFLPYTAVDTVSPETYAGNISLSRKGYFEGLGSDRSAC